MQIKFATLQHASAFQTDRIGGMFSNATAKASFLTAMAGARFVYRVAPRPGGGNIVRINTADPESTRNLLTVLDNHQGRFSDSVRTFIRITTGGGFAIDFNDNYFFSDLAGNHIIFLEHQVNFYLLKKDFLGIKADTVIVPSRGLALIKYRNETYDITENKNLVEGIEHGSARIDELRNNVRYEYI